MKKLAKFGIFTSSAILQTAIFIVSVGLIFGVSYVVGYRYLLGNTFWGNDAFSFYSVVNWFNNYFPKIPFWFPNQGGGISILAGYPNLAAFMVILLHGMTAFDLPQSFRLLGFLSVPMTAVGVFVLVWARLTEVKPVWLRQVIGLIASLIYAVAPISWIWLTRWGFYSENVSHMFVPWAILFFDLFLDRLVEKKQDFIFRISLLFCLVFLTLGTLTHFFVAAGLIPIFGLLVLLKINKIKYLFFPLAIFGILFLGLFAFRLYPYQTYNKQVAVGGFGGYAAPSQATYEETAKNMLPIRMMLSLDPPIYDVKDFINFSRSTIADMTFPFYVWALTVPALLFSFFKSKKIFLLSMYNLIGFFPNSFVDVRIFLGTHLGPLGFLLTLITGRVYFIAMGVIIPILAAYGAYAVWGLISDLILKLFSKVKVIYYLLYPVFTIAVLILTVVTFGYAVCRWYNLPYGKAQANMGAFNDKVDLRDIWHKMPAATTSDSLTIVANFDYMSSICLRGVQSDYADGSICSYFWKRGYSNILSVVPPADVIKNAQAECKKKNLDYCKAFYLPLLQQLKFSNWEPFKISSDVSGEVAGLTQKFDMLPSTPYRFDMSGYTGRYIMTAPIVTNNSMIQSYINTLSLIYNLWNYQSQSMYTQFPLYEKPGVLSEISKWFGLDYIFLTGVKQEPIKDYLSDNNWVKMGETPDGWMQFKPNPNLYSWDSRPRILIISDNSKNFYDQTFKFFTWGALSYDQAIPVMGTKTVDSYSLAELKKFDAVYMRGYDYKFKLTAYNLLDSYVKGGGKLIFDTGWQYLVPDWQVGSAPSFMPFDSLSWAKLPIDSTWSEKDFGPLVWEGQSWGVSIPGKLRSWAKPILTYDDKPLAVVGNYGKGKVLWFGFNIVPHAEAKDSLAEVKFFNSALKNYIFDSNAINNEYSISYVRPDPDTAKFTLNENISTTTNLYFRESYYPDWHATLKSGNKNTSLKIYRAGPGFMFTEIPAAHAGDTVTFTIVKPFTQRFMEFISVSTLILLIIYVFYHPKFTFNLPKFKFKFRMPKFFGNEDENENY